MDNAAWPALPPLYEEALLIHGIEQPDELVTTGDGVFYRGRRISQPTVDKFRRFRQIMRHYGGPTEQAEAVVAGEFGSSYYYYYYFFGIEGTIMSRRGRNLLLGTAAAALLALVIGAAWRLAGRAVEEPAEWTAAKRLPRIRPDYSGIVVPPNIAPLNFLVEEPGLEYRVLIRAAQGEEHPPGLARPEHRHSPAALAGIAGEEPRGPDRTGDLRQERGQRLAPLRRHREHRRDARTSTRISSTGCWDRWPTCTATWGSISATWRTMTSRRS